MTFHKGEAVVRQGEKSGCMYRIVSGTIGVYKHEKKVAELHEGDFIGEMELIEDRPCSATGIVLSETAELDRYSEDNWLELFETSPVQVYLIMKQLTEKLRLTTQDYTEACRTVHEILVTAQSHQKPSEELLEAMQRFSGVYESMSL